MSTTSNTANAPPSPPSSSTGRTTPPSENKSEWICIIPDKEDPTCLQRRLKVRPEHLAKMKVLQDKGFMAFGGIMLDTPYVPDETPAFKGSIMVAVGESREEVENILRQDPYTREDVWNWEKAEIYPFKTAVCAPLPYC